MLLFAAATQGWFLARKTASTRRLPCLLIAFTLFRPGFLDGYGLSALRYRRSTGRDCTGRGRHTGLGQDLRLSASRVSMIWVIRSNLFRPSAHQRRHHGRRTAGGCRSSQCTPKLRATRCSSTTWLYNSAGAIGGSGLGPRGAARAQTRRNTQVNTGCLFPRLLLAGPRGRHASTGPQCNVRHFAEAA